MLQLLWPILFMGFWLVESCVPMCISSRDLVQKRRLYADGYWCYNWRALHSANTSLHSPPLTGLVNKTLNDFIIISDKRKQPIINLEHFGQCRISGIPKTTSVITWMASVSTLDAKYLHSTAPSSEYQALRHSAAWSSRLVMSGGKEGHIRVTACLLLTLPCK